MGSDHLRYTASEHEVIGKWYSWLLAGIGTNEAFAAIERYCTSQDAGLAAAMKYRLEHLSRSVEFIEPLRNQEGAP